MCEARGASRSNYAFAAYSEVTFIALLIYEGSFINQFVTVDSPPPLTVILYEYNDRNKTSFTNNISVLFPGIN